MMQATTFEDGIAVALYMLVYFQTPANTIQGILSVQVARCNYALNECSFTDENSIGPLWDTFFVRVVRIPSMNPTVN